MWRVEGRNLPKDQYYTKRLPRCMSGVKILSLFSSQLDQAIDLADFKVAIKPIISVKI